MPHLRFRMVTTIILLASLVFLAGGCASPGRSNERVALQQPDSSASTNQAEMSGSAVSNETATASADASPSEEVADPTTAPSSPGPEVANDGPGREDLSGCIIEAIFEGSDAPQPSPEAAVATFADFAQQDGDRLARRNPGGQGDDRRLQLQSIAIAREARRAKVSVVREASAEFVSQVDGDVGGIFAVRLREGAWFVEQAIVEAPPGACQQPPPAGPPSG